MKRLQLPKNKFPRLGINIALIIIWLALSRLYPVNQFLWKITTEIFFFFAGVMAKFGVSLYYGEFVYKSIESFFVWTPIILVTWYFWNKNIKLRLRIYTTSSNADELKKYSNLKDQGIITEEEFQAKKKKLLDL